LLTAGLISATSTITSAANITGGNVLTGGLVSATANVTGGNVLTGGLITATGNVTGGNILTAGLISATSTITSDANVTGGNITTAGLITATANITGGNILTGGQISATGNITSAANVAGGNLKTTGGTFTGTLTTSGDALVAGNLVVQGNLTYINIDDLRVEDPVIILGTGPNGAPLTVNDGKDRGVFMEYFITAGNVLANAFMGYDNSTGNMFLATNVTMANDVVTVVTFGTLQAGNLNIQSAVSSGNITGGNLLTGGLISATGNVTGGNVLTGGVVSATANVTGGNILTGGLISATSTITSAANITGGNVLTAGLISATSTITSAANVIGGNITTAGLITATGNITGGNILTAGLISATSTITSAANITGGNILSGGLGSFTGNVTAANFIGNIIGNIDAGGSNTQIQFNDADILAGSAGFTFDKTSNAVVANGNITGSNFNTAGLVTATGNVTGGNLLTGGLISATSTITSAANITGGNLLTAGLISATSTITSAANVIGGNITTAGLVTATANIIGGNLLTGGLASIGGNITGANLILTSGTIDGPAAGRITVNASDIDTDFAVDGDTLANVFYVDAGTGTASFGTSTQVTNAIVNFAVTTSVKIPVGNTAQRPATGVTGMLRFNTTTNSVEVFDNTQYVAVGAPVFTVIDDEQFNGDGSTVAFTLGSTQTTNSCIVSINGVVQIPTSAYSVAGTDPTCVLTFTEAPISGDLIDVRQITTTTSVTQISNSPGNAIISTNPTAAFIDITGNVVPTSNITFDLGSANLRWNDLYLAGNSIVLGNTVIKNTSGNSIGFFGPDGTTAATIDAASVDTTTIANGTSNVKVLSSNGNISVTVGGSGIVTFASTGILNNMGNGTGNIGNSTGTFNTIFALATSAQYADLAEKYTADATYAPGTVVAFGGSQEITLCVNDACSRVAGVVSTNPSYRMNDGLVSEHTAMVALTGRVPTSVTGSVSKGDMMVSAGNGTARAEANPEIGTVIGKALADHAGPSGIIEVVVGRV
jgi:filamentous hemagglutinin